MRFWLVAVVLISDQLTKYLAVARLSDGTIISIIPGCLQLRYATNLGAAFSILQGQGALLSLFTVGAMTWIYWWSRSVPRDQRWLLVALSLIFGGAAGNLMDRLFRGAGLFRGHVVDFIDAYVGKHHWPTFNIADSAICVGVGLVMLAFFLYPPDEEAKESEDASVEE